MKETVFLGCSSTEALPGLPALVGCPLDLTATYRSGTGDAPNAIRIASDSIETYSPFLDLDLEDFGFVDLGDVRLSGESLEKSLHVIQQTVSVILNKGALPLCVGGEHTITLPVVRALKEYHADIVIIHLDAHSDLREHYEGSAVNHATVIRRVHELVGPGRLIQLGIRAGTKEEFSWMREQGTLMQWEPGADKNLLQRVGDRPAYVTLDLDVLDPACFPGTGNPEAGGWFYRDLERFFAVLTRLKIVGADVVELNPGLDHSQVATVAAAKIVRELLLIMGSHTASR